MIKNILKYFRKKDKEEKENPETKATEFNWIDAAENPWKVPVLDVRPITLNVVSTSTNFEYASNAVSYGQDDGTGFIGQEPENPGTVETNLTYHRDRILAPGALFIPREMEHKWAIYFHEDTIICIRGWLRKVQVVADVEQEAEYVRIKSVRGTFTDDAESPEFTERVLDYLLRSHALNLLYPAPLPEGTEAIPEKAAYWCFSLFGNMAHVATPHSIKYAIPETPLRSDSLLHVSVARGNIDEAETHLNAGLPIDLLATDGLAPMHWALVREDHEMLDYLLGKGSDVDVRSAEGATPLMNTAQSGDVEKAGFLLAKGADPNATDNRGFTTLHRAAEMGKAEIVRLLLEKGASKDVEAQGHTPVSLAKMRGEKKIIKMLGGG